MKRGGLAIALIVLLTGALRYIAPGLSSSTDTTPSSKSEGKSRLGGAAASRSALQTNLLESYPTSIAGTLNDYFGLPYDHAAFWEDAAIAKKAKIRHVGQNQTAENDYYNDLVTHWFVPKDERSHTRFVIAFLPDPAHTQLNLYFDRGVDSIEQAAQERGYNFDRATLPWDIEPHPESTDFEKREAEVAAKAQREAFPGLMIFRRTAAPEDATPSHTLLVFIVGEAPTGGVRKDQFTNALRVIDAIEDHKRSDPAKGFAGNLLILGPTFSGSLASLSKVLALDEPEIAPRRILVYSGIVRGTKARCAFEASLRNLDKNSAFVPFQDNESHLVKQFVLYAGDVSYLHNDIAILSEDETAYGLAAPVQSTPVQLSNGKPPDSNGIKHGPDGLVFHEPDPLLEPGCSVEKWGTEDLLNISFPRGIAQFRSAYARQTGLSNPDHTAGQGHAVLPLDLEATGSGDDTIPPYARVQFPLSQEAVMLGIISRLHQHHPRLIIIRSSDPVDQLFLARYLRQNFPQGRIVVSSPDLLFSREDDGLLHGVLGLSSYPLVPDLEPFLSLSDNGNRPAAQRAFPSTNDLGTYNALVALLGVDSQNSLNGSATPFACPYNLPDWEYLRCDLPPGPYVSYGSFIDWKNPRNNTPKLMPDAWITILGHDGYWTVGHRTNDYLSGLHLLAAEPSQNKADQQRPLETRHTSKPWEFAYSILLIVLFAHAAFFRYSSIFFASEAGARFGIVESEDDQIPTRTSPADASKDLEHQEDSEWIRSNRNNRARRSGLIAIGTLMLFINVQIMVAVRFAATLSTECRTWTLLFSLPAFGLACWVAWHIWDRRGPRWIALLLGSVCLSLTIFVNLESIGPYRWLTSLAAYRAMHLTSGVSPLLPILFLFGSAYVLVWFELQGLSLGDSRRPRLPRKKDLPDNFSRVSEEQVQELRDICIPLYVPLRMLKAFLLVIPMLVLTVSSDIRPIVTMEGAAFDRSYALLLFFSLLVFLGCLCRLRTIWTDCRRFLAALDNVPLREGFCRLQDFSWSLIWSPSGSAMRDSYKLVSREIECMARLRRSMEKPKCRGDAIKDDDANKIKTVMGAAERALANTWGVFHEIMDDACKNRGLWFRPDDSHKTGQMLYHYSDVQWQIARVAGALVNHSLAALWKDDCSLVASTMTKDSSLGEVSSQADPSVKKSAYQLLAEEFVSMVYANFLASILLRMRSVVVEAVGIYLLLLLSISFYPFEPNPAMFTLAVMLIVLMAIVMAYVYAQMHRDATLSRLTSTPEGELGIDFWMQLLAAGALPVLGLLAVQFPTVSHILTNFLQPALQSVK
jgi:hypothetical protein